MDTVVDETPPFAPDTVVCGAGTELVDNICVLVDEPKDDPGNNNDPAPNSTLININGRDLITGLFGGFIAAGVVSVILALMYRASRRKPRATVS